MADSRFAAWWWMVNLWKCRLHPTFTHLDRMQGNLGGFAERLRDESIDEAVCQEMVSLFMLGPFGLLVCLFVLFVVVVVVLHSLCWCLPRDVACYQFLVGTCRQPKHIQTAYVYSCDSNTKQVFVMKCAKRNVESSDEKVEIFPGILLVPRTSKNHKSLFFNLRHY